MQKKQPTHTPSKIIIYQTKNYGMFKFLGGNRDILESKVKKIVKSIKSGNNFLPYAPVCVNESMELLDGQHRYSASVLLGEHIYYTINTDNPGIEKVADLNSNTDKWKASDFINCFSDLKNENYIKLNQFMVKYKLSVTNSMMLLSAKTSQIARDKHEGEIFKSGAFKVTTYEFACKIAEMIQSFQPFFNEYKERNFIIAITKLIAGGKYQHTEMLKKLSKHNQIITRQASVKQYLTHLEELYNFRNSKRETIW
jgi:hypothetical protein